MGKLVPFGKYRGQPVERLIEDQGYCDWLMQQDWFGQKNPELRMLVHPRTGSPQHRRCAPVRDPVRRRLHRPPSWKG